MKALLRDKQIYWPHFVHGLYLVFFGGVIWFLHNYLGYAMIIYGSISWSLAEVLLGGDEIQKKGDAKDAVD